MQLVYHFCLLGSLLLTVGTRATSPCDTELLTSLSSMTTATESTSERDFLVHANCCCSSSYSDCPKCLGNLIQSSYAEENDNRVWMVTKEGINSDLIQYNRVIPGHKYIINNVGGRRLRFGPEDPPSQYVTVLGEYDCIGPLAPLATLFSKAAKKRIWWTHQKRPHEKWIFNAPTLAEVGSASKGFCVTVTDLETHKTAEIKIRVGALTQY